MTHFEYLQFAMECVSIFDFTEEVVEEGTIACNVDGDKFTALWTTQFLYTMTGEQLEFFLGALPTIISMHLCGADFTFYLADIIRVADMRLGPQHGMAVTLN